MHIFATFTKTYSLDKDILALGVLWLRKIQTALYPMQFSTGNRSTASRSHENDVFPSKNTPEVALCVQAASLVSRLTVSEAEGSIDEFMHFFSRIFFVVVFSLENLVAKF